MANIRFEQVTKQYKDGTFYNLSLEIHYQEFFVFLGSVDSGISTILRCLQGLLDVDSGRIFIDETDITDLPPKDRHITGINSSFALYPHLTVYDNLAFGLRIRHHSEEEISQQVQVIAEKFGLESFLTHKPNQLTKSQRRNLTVGRVVILNPAAFVVESLDESFEVLVENLADFHKRSELMFIYATQSSKIALALGTRIAILHNGMLQQVDTPQNLMRYPANQFVSKLLE